MAMGLGEIRIDMSDLPEVPLEHGDASNTVEEHNSGPRLVRRRVRQRARRRCSRNGHRQKQLDLCAQVEQLERNGMSCRTVHEELHMKMHVLRTDWEDSELRVHKKLERIMQAVDRWHERLQDMISQQCQAQLCQGTQLSSLTTLVQRSMAQGETVKCAQMADSDAMISEAKLGIAAERAAESAAVKLAERMDARMDECMTEWTDVNDETLKELDDRIRMLSSEIDDVRVEMKTKEKRWMKMDKELHGRMQTIGLGMKTVDERSMGRDNDLKRIIVSLQDSVSMHEEMMTGYCDKNGMHEFCESGLKWKYTGDADDSDSDIESVLDDPKEPEDLQLLPRSYRLSGRTGQQADSPQIKWTRPFCDKGTLMRIRRITPTTPPEGGVRFGSDY